MCNQGYDSQRYSANRVSNRPRKPLERPTASTQLSNPKKAQRLYYYELPNPETPVEIMYAFEQVQKNTKRENHKDRKNNATICPTLPVTRLEGSPLHEASRDGRRL